MPKIPKNLGALFNMGGKSKPAKQIDIPNKDAVYFDNIWETLSNLKTFKKLKNEQARKVGSQEYNNPRFKDFSEADFEKLLKDNPEDFKLGINDLDMDELLTGKMSWDEINEQSGQILQVGKELHNLGVSNEQMLKLLNDRFLLGGFEYDPENVKILNNMLKKVDGGELGKPNLDLKAIEKSKSEKGYHRSDGRFVVGDEVYDNIDDFMEQTSGIEGAPGPIEPMGETIVDPKDVDG